MKKFLFLALTTIMGCGVGIEDTRIQEKPDARQRVKLSPS